MVNLENVIDKTGLLVLPRQQFLTKGDSQLTRNYSLPVLVVEKIIAQTVMNNGVSCDCSCTPSSGGPGLIATTQPVGRSVIPNVMKQVVKKDEVVL